MKEPELLMIPGPTKVPPRVLQAMHAQMINHRGPAFSALFDEVIDGLKRVFRTGGDVVIFPCAGTGIMEAAVVNVLSPGDRVLVCVMGAFGERFANIARAFGAEVERLEVEWGFAVTPSQVEERLKGPDGDAIKAVFVTHNETSTGVTLDLQGVSRVVKEHPALLVVDAVSSLGAIPLEMDEWGVDVVVVGSQKALMLPPGLGVIALSEAARSRLEKATMPRFYWDVRPYLNMLSKQQTPYTPAVSLWYGLRESLRMIHEEGIENSWSRHRLIGEMARAGVRALGLELLAPPEVASNTVTAIKAPSGMDPAKIRRTVLQKYGVVLAGGQGKLTDSVFRIGHLGWVYPSDILVTLSAIERALTDNGYPVQSGAGVTAAQSVLALSSSGAS